MSCADLMISLSPNGQHPQLPPLWVACAVLCCDLQLHPRNPAPHWACMHGQEKPAALPGHAPSRPSAIANINENTESVIAPGELVAVIRE